MTLGDRSPVPIEDDLSKFTVRQLWQLYSATLIELRIRKRIRGTGTVVGDYAEYLASEGLGLALTPPITAGHDAVDADGRRYQIKGRRESQLGPARLIRGAGAPDRPPFEFLVVVLFGVDFAVHQAALIPASVVSQVAKVGSRGWRFRMPHDIAEQFDEVRDLTERFREIERSS